MLLNICVIGLDSEWDKHTFLPKALPPAARVIMCLIRHIRHLGHLGGGERQVRRRCSKERKVMLPISP